MERVNVPFALASLAISLMLWYVVLPQHLLTGPRPFTLKVFPMGLPPGLHASKLPNVIVVRAKVSDQEYNLLMQNESVRAEVDLTNAQVGTSPYKVSIYPLQLRQLIKDPVPPASVTVEPIATHKIAITVVNTGALSDSSLYLDDIELDDKQVTIDGPESEVDKVVRAQATLQLDKIDPHNPQKIEVPIDLLDAQNHVVTSLEPHPVSVVIKPKISPAPATKLVFVKPSFIGHAPEGYEVTGYTVNPDRINATGPSRVLRDLAKLSTGPIDISQLINSQTLTAPVLLPPGVREVDTKEVQVTIDIQPISVKGLNVPAGTKPSDRPLTGGPKNTL
ncbi:MAG: CdaR family protein [Fimbriimonas sp.]|nr:CdaR family protein [Fimbriimonas sp.]